MKFPIFITLSIVLFFVGLLYFSLNPFPLSALPIVRLIRLKEEPVLAPLSREPQFPMQVTLESRGNVKISGAYYPANTPSRNSVLLLHTRGSNKTAWNSFAKKLSRLGYNALTLDFRGMGTSENTENTFQTIGFAKLVFDAEAGVKFLKDQNPNGKIIIIGAGIGANVALQYAAYYPITATVALSPILRYEGIVTDYDITQVQSPVLFISSLDDPKSANASDILFIKLRAKEFSRALFLKQAGHGTNMLGKEGSDDYIIEFLYKRF
ncbi:MAG: hypothetical protein UW24_C0012G0030 [Parcubacteria group bacterium GW2011_GWA2_44_12]|nr:MAG: hypothetical protein UW24_C0012G0030 [Parcubacteria group bacterium GW2011_GWA2_44_12]